MKNKIIFPVFFALISILSSCDKVEDKVYMDQVSPPELISTPDLILNRENADDTLVFVGTPVDPGFKASIKYSLQVRKAGDESAKASSIISAFQDSLLKASVADLNGYLTSRAKPWIPTTLDFIIKAEFISSAGRGATEYIFYSTPVPILVTTYGDPRLDLIDSGEDQVLDFEDDVYTGTVDLLNGSPFTLLDPETGTAYGGSDGVLTVNGAAIVPPVDGEYMVTVNIAAMTYELKRVSAAIMDVIDSGTDQSLTSPLGDGIYAGMIFLNPDMPFTLLELDTETTYGGSDGILIADGAAISPPASGWHADTVNVNDMTYKLSPYQVGVVGAFNEWAAPDTLMDYDPAKGFWFVTMDLPVGPMKFRLNENWDEVDWGPGEDADVDLPENGNMQLPNRTGNINITTAGNYDIELTIAGTAATVKFKLN